MVIRADRIKHLLQKVAAESLNPWTIWTGTSEASATQLLNEDGLNPYVCKTSVPTEVLATGTNFNVRTEFFKVTYVNPAVPPDLNTGWFLSLDGGVTKDKVAIILRHNKVKNTYWSIILKNG